MSASNADCQVARRWGRVAVAVIAATAVGLISASPALASSAPEIESESVSHITATDATLEAQMNPNGQNDWAQFQLVEEPSEYASELLCPEHLPSPGFDGCVGPHSDTAPPLQFVPGNAAHPEAFETVTLDLASAGVTLRPGTTYHYRLLAAPAVQTEDTIQWEEPTVFGADQTFTTPPVQAPVIEAESASRISATDATLEAQINTEGLETTYQFRLESGCGIEPPDPGHAACLAITTYPLPSGRLLGSFVSQSISLDLHSAGVTLHPDTMYRYSIEARSSGGESQSAPQIFTASADLPTINSESVSHVTATDATLEATIEPRGGRSAYYQFQLAKNPSEFASEFTCPSEDHSSLCLGITPQEGALPIGWVCGECEIEPAARQVHLDLATAGITLEPDTTYHFRVIAARAVPTEDTTQWEEPAVFGVDQTFTTNSDPPVPGSASSSASNQTAPTWSLGPAPNPKRHHHRHHRRQNHRGAHHLNLAP